MVALSSTEAMLASLAHAKRATFSAYTVRPGAVLAGLEAAARAGTALDVTLDAKPYADSDGRLAAANAAAAKALRAAGAEVRLAPADRPVHLKGAVIDGEAFLDDRNWADDGAETVVKTTEPDDVACVGAALEGTPRSDGRLATLKRDALELEAHVIYGARTDSIDCESEAFSFSVVYAGLQARAKTGAHVRLLVSERDLHDGRARGQVREARALADLQKLGVEVRVGGDDEKLCIAGDRAWVGSANATDGARDDTIDWGMRTCDRAIVDGLEARFERNWARGHALVEA